MGKCQKLAGPRSSENAKNSQVHGHRKMPKSQVHVHGKISKTCRSVFMEKFLKLAGPRSWKNFKNSQVYAHRSRRINYQVRSHKNCKKCISQHLCKNTKNSQVCGHEKMSKTRRFAVKKTCKNPAGLQSQKYANKLPG